MRLLLSFVSIIWVMTAVADTRPQGQHTAKLPEEIPVGFHTERYAPVWERNPFVLVTATSQEHSPFEKLFLTSWLKDGRTDIIFVQDSDTNDVQKITATPNQAGLRLIALRLNADPKLTAAVIFDGNEKGEVKFRFEVQRKVAAAAPNPTPSRVPQTQNQQLVLLTQPQNYAANTSTPGLR